MRRGERAAIASPETRFGDNTRPRVRGLDHPAYAELVKAVFAQLQDTSTPLTTAADVAEAVWRAATDASTPMRLPAGADAVARAAQAA